MKIELDGISKKRGVKCKVCGMEISRRAVKCKYCKSPVKLEVPDLKGISKSDFYKNLYSSIKIKNL